MRKEDFEDASCSCHIAPPCSKCMSTCPDCRGFIDKDGYCDKCNEDRVAFILNVLERLQHSKTSSERNGPSYKTSQLYRDTERAINLIKETR